MVRVSMRLRHELLRRRCQGTKQYEVARAAGLHPTTLSCLINDIVPLRENDPRVLAVARVLGVPDDQAFEPFRRPERQS